MRTKFLSVYFYLVFVFNFIIRFKTFSFLAAVRASRAISRLTVYHAPKSECWFLKLVLLINGFNLTMSINSSTWLTICIYIKVIIIMLEKYEQGWNISLCVHYKILFSAAMGVPRIGNQVDGLLRAQSWCILHRSFFCFARNMPAQSDKNILFMHNITKPDKSVLASFSFRLESAKRPFRHCVHLV